MVTGGVKRRMLLVLVSFGVLPLPIIAYALGAYVITRGLGDAPARQLLGRQLLLFFTALLVAGAGGFLIWRTTTSLGRAPDIEARGEDANGALGVRLEQGGSVLNSVSRMLATIDRQANELSHLAQRLDSVNRELESTKARLHEVSFTDEVTGLHGRRFFTVRLEEEVARYRFFGHPLSLVLLELDDVKGVNDGPGSGGGDETLRRVAEILVKASRGVEVICRYGEDEFAVLVVETPGAAAQPYAERIRDILSASSFGHGRQVTASLGVCSLPEDAATGEELVRGADEALHAAKRAGKNRVVVWAGLGVGARVPRT